MVDTVSVTVTMKEDTYDWLDEAYPDATSKSMAVLQAITDARRMEKMFSEDYAIVMDADLEDIERFFERDE
jgi:hypothetical protein